MSRERLQMAHLLWERFGLNQIDFGKLSEEDRTLYAEEINRIEREKRWAARKAI